MTVEVPLKSATDEDTMVETPHEYSRMGAKELTKLLARLRAGGMVTDADLTVAGRRAAEARRRAVEAHLKTAERFLRTCEVHERAAEMYEKTAAQRESNVEARLRVTDNRAAAERARKAADAEIRRAIEAAQRTDA